MNLLDWSTSSAWCATAIGSDDFGTWKALLLPRSGKVQNQRPEK